MLTVGFAVTICLLLVIQSHFFAEYEETTDRVAALEQRNNELTDELHSTTDALSSTTDALEVCKEDNASLTDAYEELKLNVTLIQEDNDDDVQETLNDTKDDKSVSKSTNDNTIVEASTNEEIAEVIPFKSNDVESYKTTTEDSSEYTYYATKQLTAYCATGNACADGVYPSVGYTAASNDPALWHKWVYIEGVGDRYIHDTGGMSAGVIDIFMGSYSECIQFGRRSAKIYVYN